MMLVKLKNFWTLSITEAGSVFSICPSKTNSWVGGTSSINVNRKRKWVDEVGLNGVLLGYLAGVVIVEPALQVDGVPAWHQAAILEDP